MARIQDERSLGKVEKECLRLARAGEPVKAEPRRRVIDGDVVRFITETVNTAAGPGGCSVDFQGWTVRGKIDLKGVASLGYLSLQDCVIEDSLDIEFADLRALDMDGTTIGMLEGMRSRIRGSVYMRKGFRALRGVDLSGAWIEGSLTCRGAVFDFDPAPIRESDWDGDWEKHFPFEPNPEAKRGDRPVNNPFCLNLRHTTIGGTLYIGPKHQQEAGRKGQCRLLGSADLSGLRVREFVDHWTTYVQIAGGEDGDQVHPRTRHRLVLDGFEYDRFGSTSPKDAGYRIGTWLALQPDAFGPRSRRGGGVGEDFHPQPYEQLAKVLKAMGHDLDAKEVQFQRRLRQTLHSIEFEAPPRAGSRTFVGALVQPVRRAWHAAGGVRKRIALTYGWMTGFGYKPANLVVSIVALVLANSLLINVAASRGLAAPADESIAASPWWRECANRVSPPDPFVGLISGAHRINDCVKEEFSASPPGVEASVAEEDHFELHPRFNSLFFSIESFFPVLDLNQRAHWTISDTGWDGLILNWWLALYSMLGWVGTSLLVAGLFARFNQRGGD
jgi:hypothetical protein